ncbi:hypothetical protein K439DRAFT_669817 [Ramaria rubella]|nr:hypothetical protein K439DRAFT_669817 [Ramaria rubella]
MPINTVSLCVVSTASATTLLMELIEDSRNHMLCPSQKGRNLKICFADTSKEFSGYIILQFYNPLAGHQTNGATSMLCYHLHAAE